MHLRIAKINWYDRMEWAHKNAVRKQAKVEKYVYSPADQW